MLDIYHVTKKYRNTLANHDICMKVEDGQAVVLLGPNGAGKSTLIRCITGFLKFEGGIFMDEHPNKSVEAKRLIGYVPELPSFYPNLTVEEHLEFIARAYRLSDYKEYKDALLRRFELDDKRKKFGDELSKGMQQKLSICCALLPKPKLVILDEPMVGLDPHAIKELKNIFRELKAEGRSVLISTHMIDSIETLWDVTYILMNGEVKAEVHREDAGAEETLEDIFFEITEGRSGSNVSVNMEGRSGSNVSVNMEGRSGSNVSAAESLSRSENPDEADGLKSEDHA